MCHSEYGVGVCSKGRGQTRRLGHHNEFVYVGHEVIGERKMNGGVWQKRRNEGRLGLEDMGARLCVMLGGTPNHFGGPLKGTVPLLQAKFQKLRGYCLI